ncbi:MAG: sigma-70 family RNA polymerase sigma factor [Polyangiaceae bacterium]
MQRDAAPEFEASRRFLWAICYRMTGSAADADDLVQETFARALEHPPPDPSTPWRPWLTRIAVNLARDALRRRKVRGYPGQWLPEPVELDGGMLDAVKAHDDAEQRYSTFESLSYAFLVALEELTPTQRAVLLLRDALDYSVRETAEALEISEPNVKTTLHRARATMANYDETRLPVSTELSARVSRVLYEILGAMASGDVATFESLLATDIVAISDGGGQAFAAKKPVVGAQKIARMYAKLATAASEEGRLEVRELNGLPALVVEDPAVKPPAAHRSVLRIELNGQGKVSRIYSVLNPDKLRRLFSGARC